MKKNAKKIAAAAPPAPPKPNPHAEIVAGLTELHQRMLDMLAKGGTSLQLAEALGYQEGTMRVYLHHLYRKIGVANKTEAVIWWNQAKGSVPAADHPDKAIVDWLADQVATVVRGEDNLAPALAEMREFGERVTKLIHSRARPRDAFRQAYQELRA